MEMQETAQGFGNPNKYGPAQDFQWLWKFREDGEISCHAGAPPRHYAAGLLSVAGTFERLPRIAMPAARPPPPPHVAEATLRVPYLSLGSSRRRFWVAVEEFYLDCPYMHIW